MHRLHVMKTNLAISHSIFEFASVNVSFRWYFKDPVSILESFLELTLVNITIVIKRGPVSLLQTFLPFPYIDTSLGLKNTQTF